MWTKSLSPTPLIVLLIMAIAWPGEMLRGLRANGDLDKEAIKSMYYEAEFEPVSQALEDFLSRRKDASREDRIFAYKYLSVVLASREETRLRAESYMYQLLRLMPTIDLLDLYISENIELIFNNVKDRFSRMEQLEPGQILPLEEESAQTAAPATATAGGEPATSGSGSTRPWLWYAAGGVGVAALVTVFALSGDDEKAAAVHQVDIPLE